MSSIHLVLLFVALASAVLYRFFRNRPLNDLKGPPIPSFLLGNELEFRWQDEVGDLDFKWMREYGTAWRFGGCFGEDVLMLADPKGLQYVFHTAGYHFPKTIDMNQNARLLVGRGIVTAAGEGHQRQRRIMNPAFSASQLKSFLPLFRKSASQLTQKWKDELQNGLTGEAILNVNYWIARTTLDVIGEAAFDYRFDALNDGDNQLMKALKNIFADSFLHPSAWNILFRAIWRYIPPSVVTLVQYIPTGEYRRSRKFLLTAKSIAKDLIREKSTVAMNEKGSKDIMSILVQSNTSTDAKRRLDDDEMISQMATLMLAGHETTANSLSWLLYELVRNPEDQRKIREEIATARAKMAARGDEDFTVADLDELPYMNAAIKESLRLHPVGPHLFRWADRDDVIPLASPIETKSGKLLSEIPVKRGQSVILSICGYHRLKSVWGEDADTWNPNRFLDGNQDRNTSVGVYANLLTFAAGVRACIGWRFSIIEMQALLVELVENFEFKEPGDGIEMKRVFAGSMVPMVRGKVNEGAQMPIQVSILQS